MFSSRKVIRVSLIVAALAAACLVLFFLLAPRLINTETVSRKVSEWITEKTDGMVTFRRVEVGFFPRPRVAVSEVSAAIPDKGTVTAGSVTVYLSFVPLLSGKVDVAKVLIAEPKVSLDLTPRDTLPEKGRDGTGEKRSADELLAGLVSRFPGLSIAVDNGTVAISKENRTLLTLSDVSVSFSTLAGNVDADIGASAGFSERIGVELRVASADSPDKVSLEIKGSDVDIRSLRETAVSLIPDNPTVKSVFSYLRGGRVPEISVRMTGQRFGELGGLDDLVIMGRLQDGLVFIPGPELTFQNVGAGISVSGGLLRGEGLNAGMDALRVEKGLLAVGLKGHDAPFHLEVDTKMDFGEIPVLLGRFLEKRPFPFDRLRDVRGPVSGRLVLGESLSVFAKWTGKEHLGFDGRIRIESGLVIDLALAVRPKSVEIRKLTISDGATSADFTVSSGVQADRVSFKGRIERKTIDRLIELPNLPEGFMEGEIDVSINRKEPLLSTAHGRLSAERMPVRLQGMPPVDIDRVRLKAEGNRITVESLEAKVAGNAVTLKGSAALSPREIGLDLDVAAKTLKWEEIKSVFKKDRVKSPGSQKAAVKKTPLTGSVRFGADGVLFGTRRVSPVHAVISLAPDKVGVSLPDLMYCGFRTPGKVSVSGDTINVDLGFNADSQDLSATIDCLTDHQGDISGKFAMKGSLSGKGNADEIAQGLHGGIEFRADGGRINKSIIFLDLYSLLNVTGYFSGNVANLFRKGIPYRSITLTADVRDGKMIIREANMDAPSLKVVAAGEIDLVAGKFDLKMLATPLTTVDVVLGKVPLIGKVTPGSIVSLPVSVTGDLRKPVVSYSRDSSHLSDLTRQMKKSVEAPITIVQPEEPGKERP